MYKHEGMIGKSNLKPRMYCNFVVFSFLQDLIIVVPFSKFRITKSVIEILSHSISYHENEIPNDFSSGNRLLLFTPPKTPRISRLKSQILKPPFLS